MSRARLRRGRCGALVGLGLALAACAGRARSPGNPLVDSDPVETDSGAGRLLRELEIEVLSGYDRLTLDVTSAAAAIDPAVGLMAIGVGPDEVGVSRAAYSRWPVTEVGDRAVDVVSRSLELHLSADRTVGWTFDQISLHLQVCGHVASIPLRASQVYVRDSERWTLVAEHLAYAQPQARVAETAPGPTAATPDVIERQPESPAALDVLTRAFTADGERERTWDGTVDSFAVWPEARQVLRGDRLHFGPSLAASLGATGLDLDGTRLALGPSRQVAIAATTIVATVDRGAGPAPLRLRASAVLERAGDEPWRMRMAMVSAPISPVTLVERTIGVVATAVVAGRVTTRCTEDGGRVARAPR